MLYASELKFVILCSRRLRQMTFSDAFSVGALGVKVNLYGNFQDVLNGSAVAQW